jgi:hypothetical protein
MLVKFGLLSHAKRTYSSSIAAKIIYKSRLISLNLLPISYWLECRDLCFVYKYMSGSFNVQLENSIQVSSGRTRSSTDSLILYPVHRLRIRDFSFNRVGKLRNNLPLEIRKSSSISAFNYYFDTDRLSTWKTICPSRRSIGSPSCWNSEGVLLKRMLHCIIPVSSSDWLYNVNPYYV